MGSFGLPCEIGSDAWIGANAVILRGVKVGIGSVVGAGAVVTSDIPDFAVFGGVPAKLIRYRFSSTVCEALLAPDGGRRNHLRRGERWQR